MRRSSVLIGLSLGCCLLSAPAYGAITVEPDALVISGLENQQMTRTLNLSSDTDIRQLAIVGSDLERTDSRAVVPASVIQIDLPQTALQAGTILQVPITINTSRTGTNGEFIGVLWMTYDGNLQTIPITVRTKDPIALPLIVLLAGVALGSLLAWYRRGGLPQDELVVRMGQLRMQLRSDAEMETVGKRFRQQIESNLIDVESALGGRKWAAAETSLAIAEATWNRWRKGREDWILQIQYLQTLQQQAGEPSFKNTDYGARVLAELEEVERRIAEFETPQALREALLPLRDSINRFQEGQALVTYMAKLETRMAHEQRDYWGTQREVLQAELDALDPKSPDAYSQWKANFEQQQRAMVQDLHRTEQPELQGTELEAVARRDMLQLQQPKLPLVPGVSSYSSEGAVRSARSRLRIFRLVSQAVAIGFLSWAGLNELYEGNPIFGASPVGDYLSLAAWGFGAEVTRDSIVRAVKELNGTGQDNENPSMT